MNSQPTHDARGFTLIEVLIALAITLIVMASVFALLHKGQDSFRREPQVADMNANARAGLERVSQDLTFAGYETPANMAVMWFDGPNNLPDELTIVYADANVPLSRPEKGPPSATIGRSATLFIDPTSFSTCEPSCATADVTTWTTQGYTEGMTLMAIQGPNGDPACDTEKPSITPFTLTQDSLCTSSGGKNSGPANCPTVQLNHNPRQDATLNLPGGFDNQVKANCATIGWFHVIQYRVNPLPPTPNPMLERRDVSLAEPWTPVAVNIENFQVQYAQGVGNVFNDVPLLIPMGNDLNSWITQVQVTVSGRSESTNLQGATQGVFASDDTHLRRSFSTVVSLRNQLGQAAIKAINDGIPMAWN